jgi:Uma2 family endonuclease
MAPSSRPRATYQDVLDAPAHLVAEIVDGELTLSPRPSGPHAMVATALAGELVPPFGSGRGGPGGWIILFEPELHLGADILIPDLAGWRRERLPSIEDVPYFTLAPDWLCEVLSPSTEKLDRASKLGRYAAAGVGHVWLVNPSQRTLEVFRRHEDKWLCLRVHTDDARIRAEPFEAIELDLSVLWADLSTLPTRVSEGAAYYAYADKR